MLECGDVIRYLHDVVEPYAGRLIELEEQKVRQRRLCSFDLRRKHSLTAYVRV